MWSSEQGGREGGLDGCLRGPVNSSSSLLASRARFREADESISSSSSEERGSEAEALSVREVSCARERGLAWGGFHSCCNFCRCCSQRFLYFEMPGTLAALLLFARGCCVFPAFLEVALASDTRHRWLRNRKLLRQSLSGGLQRLTVKKICDSRLAELSRVKLSKGLKTK